MESEPGLFYWLVVYLSFIVGMYNFLELTNWYLCILGWELMGVCSFYLIGTFSSRAQAISSSSLALCINRVGDICLFLAMLNGLWPLLLFSVLTKSSMLMFSGWLPNAMEGPTPVSALLHSSTMVVAGVSLTVFFDLVSTWVAVSFTVYGFLMGLRGCRFPDYKRVIAFSTSSQLALVAALSLVGGHTYAFIYILVHAIFKSNMFMVCGVQAHSTGNLWIGMATTGVNCICFITSICVVAMAGVSDHSTAVIKDSMLGLGVEHMYTYVFTAYALSTILYSIYLLVVRAYNAYDHGKTMLAIEYHLAILAGFLMVAVNVTNTAQSGYHMVGWSLFLLACAAGAYLHISSLDLDAAFFRRHIVEFTYLNRVRGLHTGATTYAKVNHCGYYGNKLTDCLMYCLIALWILDELVGCIIWFSIIFHDPTSVDADFLVHDRWEERP